MEINIRIFVLPKKKSNIKFVKKKHIRSLFWVPCQLIIYQQIDRSKEEIEKEKPLIPLMKNFRKEGKHAIIKNGVLFVDRVKYEFKDNVEDTTVSDNPRQGNAVKVFKRETRQTSKNTDKSKNK